MSLAIIGLGTAVPPHALPQTKLAQVARVLNCRDVDQVDFVEGLYQQTGITTRHMIFGHDFMDDVLQGTSTTRSEFLPKGPDDSGPLTRQRMRLYRKEALPLALRAARKALEESRLPPRELTHLVTVSCTGFSAPGVDVGLIKALDLAPSVQRTHVGFMGCHGAINGLRVARAFTDSDPSARVLLCAVELCSLHAPYGWQPKAMVASALFADGAGAIIGVPTAETSDQGWRITAAGSHLFPGTEDVMSWDIGNHGFEMTLSKKIPGLIAGNLGPWLTDWLAHHGLAVDAVGSWAVHPGGPRILTGVEEALHLDHQALACSREVLAEYGNMSSPTVLFILERLRTRGAALPCVVLGFGPGLMAEVVLVR